MAQYNVFIAGLPGSGKTSIVETANSEIEGQGCDLDWFGHWLPTQHGNKWLIDPRLVSKLMADTKVWLYAGNSSNVFRPVKWMKITDRRCSQCTYTALTALKWDHIFYLWYEPTVEQHAIRFGPQRLNDYGKDQYTWAQIQREAKTRRDTLSHLSSRDRKFTFIDVTSLTPKDSLNIVQEVIG